MSPKVSSITAVHQHRQSSQEVCWCAMGLWL